MKKSGNDGDGGRGEQRRTNTCGAGQSKGTHTFELRATDLEKDKRRKQEKDIGEKNTPCDKKKLNDIKLEKKKKGMKRN